ncbi:Vinculin/alpha-catenin [Phlyctochytrium arcticum]|nr:Vinculin/alpha-catenin [Phlyctochytrium arcticum]
MHTTTSKAVLTPLADAVSALIVIVSDAETEGTPIPDLTGLASGVQAQIANLVNVGKKIQAQPSADGRLKAEMPAACDEVTNSAQNLVNATHDLGKDPYSPKGRQLLLEGVKGILSGTTAVLNVFDEAEVRKILSAASVMRAFLDAISLGPASPKDTSVYVQTIAQTSQTIVVLTQLTNKRVSELLYEVLRTRLKAALATLMRESGVLIGACKVSLVYPDNKNAVDGRKQTCQRLLDAVKEIEIVVQFRTEEEGLASETVSEAGKLKKALQEDYVPRIANALAIGDTNAVRTVTIEQARVADVLVGFAQDQLQQSRDTKQTQQGQAIVNEIAQAQVSLQEAVAALAAHPTDAARRAVQHAVDVLLGRTDALQTSVNRSVISEAGTVLGSVANSEQEGTLLNRIHGAALRGEQRGFLDDLEAFGCEASRLQNVANAAIDAVSTSNPQMAQDLRAARNRTSALALAYSGAARLLVNNPNDPMALEHYQAVKQAWEEGVAEVQKMVIGQEGIYQAGDLVEGTKSSFLQHAEALRAAATAGDAKTSANEAALVATSAQQFIAIAKKEADNTDDQVYRRELELKISQVETVLPSLLNGARSLLDDLTSGDLDAASEFSAIVGGLTFQLAGLGNVIRQHKGGAAEVLTQPPPAASPREQVVPVEDGGGIGARQKEDELHSSLTNLATKVGTGMLRKAGSQTLAVDTSLTARPHAPQPHLPAFELPPALALPEFTPLSGLSSGYGDEHESLSAEMQTPNADELQSSQEELAALTEQFGNDFVLVHNEAKPVLLSEEEAKAEPIRAAGQQLKVEASNWSHESNSIVAAVASMSNHLLDLSAMHTELRSPSAPKAASKKAFIASAQAITSEANQVARASSPLIAACTDRRLRSQLVSRTDRIQTLGQQLKIVAAVKASAPQDRDRDAQMVACATNLMGAVKECLRDCESAALRISADKLKEMGVEFRRKVYRARQFGSTPRSAHRDSPKLQRLRQDQMESAQ